MVLTQNNFGKMSQLESPGPEARERGFVEIAKLSEADQ
jgi:hypothetical protein